MNNRTEQKRTNKRQEDVKEETKCKKKGKKEDLVDKEYEQVEERETLEAALRVRLLEVFM